jgi:hypothetical protein
LVVVRVPGRSTEVTILLKLVSYTPKLPQLKARAFSAFADMVKEDLKKGITKDRGAFCWRNERICSHGRN